MACKGNVEAMTEDGEESETGNYVRKGRGCGMTVMWVLGQYCVSSSFKLQDQHHAVLDALRRHSRRCQPVFVSM